MRRRRKIVVDEGEKVWPTKPGGYEIGPVVVQYKKSPEDQNTFRHGGGEQVGREASDQHQTWRKLVLVPCVATILLPQTITLSCLRPIISSMW